MYNAPSQARPSAPLVRVPTGRQLDGIFISERPYRFRTHWHLGRSLPCVVHACPLCQAHSPARIYGYVGALVKPLGTRAVVELPHGALIELASMAEERGSIAGLGFRAWRADERRTAMVQLRTFDPAQKPDNLPAIDVVGVLCTLWEVPQPKAGECEDAHAREVRAALWTKFGP